MSEAVTQVLLSGPHEAGLRVHCVGRRRAGQAAAAVAELHALHGRHHLRRRLHQRGAAGGGQVGAAKDLQVDDHRRQQHGRHGQDQEQHPYACPRKHAGRLGRFSTGTMFIPRSDAI